jgi:gamma-glutamylcyclotransferase
MKYFAYGSNMSIERLKDRKINWTTREKGIIKGYKLVINKRSKKNPNIGFANIVEDENSIVEGIIYDIPDEDVYILDKYEGVNNNHYYKTYMYINNESVLVYIANGSWLSDKELETTEEYKNFILEGKEFLSKEYINKLLEIKTI